MTSFKQGVNTDGEVLRDFYVEHDPVDLECPDDGMTRQEFRDECDINVLMATYEKNGMMPPLNRGTPQYLDVSNVPDLAAAIAVIDQAEAAFMSLPAKVRKEFDNDAIRFVEFAQDPENIDQLREWGLAPSKQAPIAPAEPAGASGAPGGSPGAPPASKAS